MSENLNNIPETVEQEKRSNLASIIATVAIIASLLMLFIIPMSSVGFNIFGDGFNNNDKNERLSIDNPLNVDTSIHNDDYQSGDQISVKNGSIVYFSEYDDVQCPKVIDKAFKNDEDVYVLVVKKYDENKKCGTNYILNFTQTIKRSNGQPVPEKATIKLYDPINSVMD